MSRLVVATKNEGKVVEIRAALIGVEVETLRDHPELEMPEETGATFAANAQVKAEYVASQLGVPVLADDSGLVVDALNGRPGVHSARYAPGSDKDRCDKLLADMADVADADRTARFMCAMAFAVPGEPTVLTFGKTEGTILRSPRGTAGFGYDPVFGVADDTRSMAELSVVEKNALSHRGRALTMMRSNLADHFSLE